MNDDARHRLAGARRIVVKIGSRLLAESPAGRPAAIADQVAQLRAARNLEVVIVSSGAISLGVRALRLGTRPSELPMLQAAAAVGQGRLMQHWEHAFAAHDTTIAQILLTHEDLADRKRFLNARHALRALLDAGVVPIVNENDTVSVDEIKFGDNDLLAALTAAVIGADALLILTDVEGLRGANGVRMPLITDIDAQAAPVAGGTTADGVGSGGMASKVAAARIAGKSGIFTAIAPGRLEGVLAQLLSGVDVGSVFMPPVTALRGRKHWIAYGAKPAGRIIVDEGAVDAVSRAGRSLLPAGVVTVEGAFDLGDLVSLITPQGDEFARGLAGYSARDLQRIRGVHSADIALTLGYKYLDEAIHRDDLVLL